MRNSPHSLRLFLVLVISFALITSIVSAADPALHSNLSNTKNPVLSAAAINSHESPLSGQLMFSYENYTQAWTQQKASAGWRARLFPARVAAQDSKTAPLSTVGTKETRTGGNRTDSFAVIDEKLAPSEAAGLKSLIQNTLHAFSYNEVTGDWYARNAANQITFTYTRYSTAKFTEGDNAFGLTLIGIGRGDGISPAGKGHVQADGRQLNITRPEYTEWYKNNDECVEQGMTLASSPDGTGHIKVAFDLSGTLTPTLEQQTLVFSIGNSPVFRYSGLTSRDATGRNLPVMMTLAGTRLVWQIDDHNAVYPITIDPYIATQNAILNASDADANANFGLSVSIYNDTAIVGAFLAKYAGKSQAGEAYIFKNSGGTWSQIGSPLGASGAANGDKFGYSVSIYNDTAIIGASEASGLEGRAYIFKNSGGAWSQVGSALAASDKSGDSYFGHSVSIYNDTAIVGADKATWGHEFGKAYIFKNSGGIWSQVGSPLTASDAADNAFFGNSVSIYNDTAIIGAYGAKYTGLSNSGKVYIFKNSGGAWSQIGSPLTASDAAMGYKFGHSVSIYNDTAIVGSDEATYGALSYAGKVYIFKNSGGAWSQVGSPLTASDTTASAYFGNSVSIYNDTAIIGAYGVNSSAGKVYIFKKNGDTWSQEGSPFIASDVASNAQFGTSVSIYNDTAIVGAPQATYNSLSNSGQAYVYTLTEEGPAPVASFTSTNVSVVTNSTAQGWAGVAPFSMVFNDTSTNTPTSWKWDRNNLTVATWEQFSTTNNATLAFVAGNWSIKLTATNSGGSGISGITWVNVSAATATPTITLISPGSGPLAAGTLVNITGTNLAGATSVTFGSNAATGITNTATTINMTAPAGSAGPVTVTVTTPGGTATTSYTYTGAPIAGVIGFRWNTSDPSPRLYQIDSDGTVIPNATGDWFNTHLPWSGMKTVVVNATNATPVLYGSDNRGTGLSLTGQYGDVMVEIPKFYTCSTYANGNFSYWISPTAQDALHYTVAPMFNQRGTGTDAGTAAAYYYVGRYDANLVGSKLQSATGKAPAVSMTITTARTYAENKGSGWGITNIWTSSALRQLFYTEMVTLDSQTAWTGSRGIVDFSSGSYNALDSGAGGINTEIYTINATGSGTGENGKTPVSYRGIENLWGNVWQFQDGVTATTLGTNVANSTGLGLTGQATTFAIPLGVNNNQSVGALVSATGDDGKYQTNWTNTSVARPLFLPSAVGGSDSTYLSDYYFPPSSINAATPNILFSGGAWYDQGGAGVGSLVANKDALFSHEAVGARLEFRFSAPGASFSSTNTSVATNTTSQGLAGVAPFTMVFNDTSTGTPISWVWNATNNTATPLTWSFNLTPAAQANISYTFPIAGNYTIKLNATNSLGTNISTQVTWVNVSAATGTPPVASFSSRNTSTSVATNSTSQGWTGVAPFSMVFNDTSTGTPISWVWNATNVTGNNVPFYINTTTVTLANISYEFKTAGNYTIKLNATNSLGSSISTQVTWVNVSAAPATPTITGITPSSGQNTTSISITNLAGTNFQSGASVLLTPANFIPTHKGSISNGDGGALLSSPHSVYVSGNYAYVASEGSNALEIIDISNPAAPTHKGSIANEAGGALLNVPYSVYVSGNYAYVASYISHALEIVDVSNPAVPTHKGSIVNGDGGALLRNPRSVYVSGNYAYVASEGSNALEIVDISNPAAPTHKGSIANEAGGALLNVPDSVYVSGNYAYVTSYYSDALEIVDISNPAAPTHKGSIVNGDGGALLKFPDSVYVSGNYAYVTSYNKNALEIVDISNPAVPTHKGSIVNGDGGALLTEPWSVYISGNYAYVGVSNNALEIVDVSNPAAPAHKGSIVNGVGGALLVAPYSVYVSGNYAYVASHASNALEIVTIGQVPATGVSVPAATKITCSFNLTNYLPGLYNVVVTNPDGNFGILGSGFTVTNITPAAAPTVNGITPATGQNTSTISITNLSGTNFMTGNTVKLNRSGFADINGGTVLVVSSTNITTTFDLTNKLTGQYNVVVTNTTTGLEGMLVTGFTVTNVTSAPAVTSVSPVTSQNTTTALKLNLTGTGFNVGTNQWAVNLTKAGQTNISATSIISDSTTINCTFDLTGHIAGSWFVNVTNPDGQTGAWTSTFTVTNVTPAPAVTGVSPVTSQNTTTALKLNLTGTGFNVGTNQWAVNLTKAGQTNISATSIISDSTTINCTFDLTGHMAGSWFVNVTNADGQTGAWTSTFTVTNVTSAPAVTSVSPVTSQNTTTALKLNLTGTGFNVGTNQWAVNLTKAGQTNISATTVDASTSTTINCTFDLTGHIAGSWFVNVTNTDGQTGAWSSTFTVTNVTPAPAVTGVSPVTSQNTTTALKLNLTGTGFNVGTNQWAVNLTKAGQTNISATSITSDSTTINCTFDLTGHMAGSWFVNVTNPDGQTGAWTSTFTVTNVTPVPTSVPTAIPTASPAPTVTGITPATGVNTSTVSITNLAGTGFLTGATVKLTKTGQPDLAATGVTVVSATQITCTVDLNGKTVGLWNVLVTNPDAQTGTFPNGFTITSGGTTAPTITGITPATGQNTTSISITNLAGTGFISGATVKLTKTGQPDIAATGVTVASATQINCTIDLTGKIAGQWNVVVTNPDAQTGTLPNGFTITSVSTPAPTVIGITPATGVNTSTVSITNLAGTGFLTGAMVKLTKTGQTDIAATGVTIISATQINCTIDLNGKTIGPWNVVVTNPDTQTGTLPNGFTITSVSTPAPTITGITPATGVNTSTVSITNLAGTGFLTGATVKLTKTGQTDIAATGVTVVSATQINCTIDLTGKIAGQWNIVVTNPDAQTGTLPNGFTVTSGGTTAPTITGITPATGANTSAVSITNLAGTGFLTGATVKLTKTGQPDIAATGVTVISATQITCTIDLTGKTAGQWNVVVTNPDAQTGTHPNGFTITSINPAPVADFTGSPTEGTAPLTITFTDLSTRSPTSWNWSFGDGGTSTEQNPAHTYSTAGIYTVLLTATNAGGSTTMTRTKYITVFSTAPEASFNGTPTDGTAPLSVTFTDNSIRSPTSWNWLFGDGVTSTDQNPAHTYLTAGAYTVRLTATNAVGNTTMTRSSYITAFSSAPEAYFTATPAFGTAPLPVTFTDGSTRSPTRWNWSFGDGSTSTEQNPSHTYLATGTNTVSLIVTNAGGSDTITRTIGVYATQPVNATVANFTPTQTSFTNMTFVTNSTSSTNAMCWYWDFGDGTTSTEQNPVHTYSTPGTYTITLTTTNGESCSSTTAIVKSNAASMVTRSTMTLKVNVYALAPQPDFTATPQIGNTPLPVLFTDRSTRFPTSWNWSFGDGGASTEKNPAHIYSAAGNYTVSLTVTNSVGNDTLTRTNYITVSAFLPQAYFSGTPVYGTAPLPVTFTDGSARSPTSWNWNFGDGGTSTAKNPVHTYSSPGTYTVSLNATNALGSDTITRSGYITVTNVPPAPTITRITPSSGLNTGIVSITNLAGTGFYGTPTVNLIKTGQSSIPATGVTVVDSTKITCTFNLAGKTTGLWDVTVVNPDGQQGSLVEGFMIYDVPIPTPTPEGGGGGGGDTPLPAQPGQYGSGMAIANEAPAGQTVSYSFGTPTKLYPVSIQSISFVPDKMVPQSQCLVQQQGPATAFGLTDRPVAYESIEIGWINPAVITSGKIHFSVLGSWLREKHIDPTNVVLLRSHDLVWTELPTMFDRMEGDNYYYNSDTPGFSYFAVSDRRTPAAAIATPQVTISRSAEIQPASPSVTATDIITSVPTKTQTPVPATPAPEAGSGSPVLYYLAGVVIVVVLVAGGFLIRRWWIRRQNPTLFRELD